MHRSALRLIAALLLVVPVAAAVAAAKEEPFKYRNMPVEASCLDGYHPTIDADGNKVFPCIANAETVVPTGNAIKGKTGSAR